MALHATAVQLRNPFPFDRNDLMRSTAGGGCCANCGQRRKSLFTYWWQSPMGRDLGGNGKAFCGRDCWSSYEGM